MREELLKDFASEFYYSNPPTWGNVWWLGYQILKNPMDLWVYQEIIYSIKPDVIIECGTGWGGSAFYFATLFDLVGKGRIISIDIREDEDPEHPKPKHWRIKYLIGDSSSDRIIGEVVNSIEWTDKVMVILDSDHRKEHVAKELQIYSQFVTPGSYLIVEDTQLNHRVKWSKGEGPLVAVEEFLSWNNKFKPDFDKEKFCFTFNPKGFLKRV